MATKGSGLKSTSINGVKMYMVSSQQRNPASWVGPKKQRPSRKDKNYQQKIELVQDLTFPTATSRIKVTPDGEFLIASGIYPPQIKVYELREFALKFERHFDSEIIDFQILDDDYSKLAFLCTDRSVYLHAKYGKHYSLRIPRMGRDMAYDCWSCDLLCAASSSDLYRINLEKVPKKLPKVNRKLAASVIEKEAEIEQIEADKNETKKASKKKKGLGPEIFEDERFKALFEDKDFEIDENSAEYLALHPMASMKQPSLVAEHFELLTEDEDQGLSDSDNSAASQSSGDEHSNKNRKFKKKPR